MNRREAIAALASTAALPLLHGCGDTPSPHHHRAAANAEADALALLDQIGENYLRFAPESATSLGIDTGARAALRSQLADRSRGGQQKIASQVRQDLDRAKAFDTSGLSHATRTSVEVVRSAYQTAAEGFALPYGDITVGSWRNTPYVVIQNVGAYLDIPRFLDSDHPIENAADAEAYLARLQSYAKQLDGELGRIQAARGKGLVPPAFLIDKALAQMRMSAKNARDGGSLVESIARRTKAKSIPGNWARARAAIAAQEIAPALDRQIAELEAQRKVAKDDAGMWARPNGDEFYRWALKASTTTNMTPDEVHAMGQSELEELHARDGHDPEGHRLHHRHGRRAHAGARQGSALPIRRRRQGPRRDHGVHPGAHGVDPRAAAARVQHAGQSEHGSEAAAAGRGAWRADRVRRRRIDRRQDPGTLLDQPRSRPRCTASTASPT